MEGHTMELIAAVLVGVYFGAVFGAIAVLVAWVRHACASVRHSCAIIVDYFEDDSALLHHLLMNVEVRHAA
jgi:hypothetical protein